MLHPRTDWAKPSGGGRAKRPAHKQRGLGGDDDDDGDDASEEEEEEEEGVSGLLAQAGGLVSARASRLAPGHVETSRLKDGNVAAPSKAVVRSVGWHPSGQLLLTAGLDKKLRLFKVCLERGAGVCGCFAGRARRALPNVKGRSMSLANSEGAAPCTGLTSTTAWWWAVVCVCACVLRWTGRRTHWCRPSTCRTAPCSTPPGRREALRCVAVGEGGRRGAPTGSLTPPPHGTSLAVPADCGGGAPALLLPVRPGHGPGRAHHAAHGCARRAAPSLPPPERWRCVRRHAGTLVRDRVSPAAQARRRARSG